MQLKLTDAYHDFRGLSGTIDQVKLSGKQVTNYISQNFSSRCQQNTQGWNQSNNILQTPSSSPSATR